MGDDTLSEELMAARIRIGRLEQEVEDLRLLVGGIVNRVIELENATGQHKPEGDDRG